jgi:16S rRNA (guanine527-N7)-methyltransferase
MPAADWQRLGDWAQRVAGLTLTGDLTDKLRILADLLRLWNRKISLVASANAAVVLDKHIADSLFAAAHCRDAGAVVDLGSGAGFPGLVIAMAAPSTRVTLIEARGKKVSFLEEVCRVAALTNAEAVHGRIEVVGAEPRHREAYDVATSRALADLALLRTLAAPFLRASGRLVAMRSAAAPVPPAATHLDYTLPDGSPRVLLLEPRPLS